LLCMSIFVCIYSGSQGFVIVFIYSPFCFQYFVLRVSYARPLFILYRAFSTYVHPVFCYPDHICFSMVLASTDLRAWGSVSDSVLVFYL
jgi:hypothetical protein